MVKSARNTSSGGERAGCGRLALEQVGQREGIDSLGGVGEVGMDLEAVEVADDQERRVLEVLAVLEQLLIGRR